MLNAITIKNFRCFPNIKVSGFKNINLIGGQNNSGKTALLEALLLSFFPTPDTIVSLREFRNENNNLVRKATEKVWNYFFYNQDKSKAISIATELGNNQVTNVEMSCTKDIENVIETLSNISGNGNDKISDFLYGNFSDTILLNIKGILKHQFNYYLLPDRNNLDGKIAQIGKIPINSGFLPFLHTGLRLNDENLVNLYSQTKENSTLDTLNNMLHLLDNRIISSEIDAPGGEPMIKLILDNKQSFPLSMFGDAVRKVTELMLILLNNTTKVIFIDEIENGIHFTKHKDLWTKLFEVVGDDIQIFATSHSAEMIKAFNDVAYQTPFENKGMYFEMGRTQKTQQIVVNPIDMEMLNYKILTNSSFRAE